MDEVKNDIPSLWDGNYFDSYLSEDLMDYFRVRLNFLSTVNCFWWIPSLIFLTNSKGARTEEILSWIPKLMDDDTDTVSIDFVPSSCQLKIKLTQSLLCHSQQMQKQSQQRVLKTSRLKITAKVQHLQWKKQDSNWPCPPQGNAEVLMQKWDHYV